MGLGRLVLTGRWKRQRRKPTLFERVLLGDRDNSRRGFTRDEVFRVSRRGFFNLGKAQCAYPGCWRSHNLHIDHKKSLFRGGSNHPSNLQLLCRKHNLRKGSR